MTTRVFIIEAPYRDAADGYAEAQGWGGPVFVQPLSPTGQEPVTNWGFPAVVDQAFIDLWDSPPEEAAALVAAVQIDTRDGKDTAAHWRDAIAAAGLTVVVLEDIALPGPL